MSFSWNEETIATAKKLWLEGRSASDIAVDLGAASRNAVIGKMHRLGLARDSTTVRFNVRRGGRIARAKQPQAPKPARTRVATNGARTYQLPADRPLPPVAPELIPLAPRPWLTREDGECAAPAGGEGADMLSCCNATGGGQYCPAHRQRMSDSRSTLNLIGKGGVVPRWALT